MEAELTIHISTTIFSKEEKDTQVWGNDEKGCFTVNVAYECLAKHERGPHLDVYDILWKSKAFPSVLTTTWRVLMDRIPTRECLSRRGVTMNSILCALCQTMNESCQHLFLECRYATSVWAMCYRWMSILFVQHNDLKTHFESFQLFQVSYNQNLVWKGVWTTIVRCISDHRNLVMFKQSVVDAEDIFQKAQISFWLWLKHKAEPFYFSLADWILNPMLCINSYK